MTSDVFLILLFVISSLTGLAVEAIKRILKKISKTYRSNIIAGVSSVVISIGISAAYIIFTDAVMNDKMAVYLIALVFLSWLCSMLGYDKVKQTIMQFKFK